MISGKSALAWLSALVLCFGVPGCVEPSAPRTIHVLGTWVGAEQDLFESVLKPFEERTGIDVRYEGTRDFAAVLAGRVQSGDAPDLALLASPGQFEEYAGDGRLVPLDEKTGHVDLRRIPQEYSSAWLSAGLAADENGRMRQFGVIVRGKRKNVVWYSRTHWGWPEPHTWAELVKVSRKIADSGRSPWCVGLRDGSSSGWPGTDWIEDILLRQSGPETYRRWFRGELEWTSPPVRDAWQAWGEILKLDPPEGALRMLLTGFKDAEETMFAAQPGCYLRRIGYLATSVYQNHRGDFDFFDLTGDAHRGVEIAGDLLTMFRRTPAAEELMNYLTGSEAQSIWVKPGGAISPNVTAEVTDNYPDEATRRLARSVNTANCKDVVFDASDEMPPTMRNAFHQAVIEFVAMPQQLTAILNNLDAVRRGAYPAADTAPSAAGDGSITC
jgi:alpha-glucoside transport system substrate-binding protein